MKITKIPGLGSFGQYIDDVDFNTLTDEEWLEIGRSHLKCLVTIIRNVNLNYEDQPNWMTKWGDTRYGIQYMALKKYPNLRWSDIVQKALQDDPMIDPVDSVRFKMIYRMLATSSKPGQRTQSMKVSGQKDKDGNPLGMFAEGELLWHSNESGTLTFTPGVSLLGWQNMVGSATGFLTTTDYYYSVSDSFRSELDDMILIHKFTPGKINPGLRGDQDEVMHGNMCPIDDVEIPMVITSPGGLVGLHYSINTVDRIKGMTHEESQKVFAAIDRELFTDKYIFDHWYQNDRDLLLFDNSITLHRRLGDIKDRLAYRIQHDYSNAQDSVWNPYRDKETLEKYWNEMALYVQLADVKDFKLPV